MRPLPDVIRNHATALGLAAGLLVGLQWFVLLVDLGTADRLRGDAAEYLRIALGFSGWADAIGYVGERSVGFPLVLFALKRLFSSVSSSVNAMIVLDFFSLVFFCIHVASVLVFFFTLRRHAASRGVRLHWALGALLLAYPGLVAHTTVTLTDTFCADLVMLAFGAAVRAAGEGGRRRPLLAFAGGALLGFAVLCRPPLEVAAVLAAAAAPLALLVLPLPPRSSWAQAVRSRVSTPAFAAAVAFALGYAACTVPAEAHCAARYGTRCLMNPERFQRALLESLRNGMDSPRLYWSKYAALAESGCGPGCVALRDETLAATWAVSCRPSEDAFGYGVPGCFLRRPDLGLLFLSKKSVGLFDSYQLQDYAVDLTPGWARLWSRPFGALAFAGFVLSLVLLAGAARDPRRGVLAGLLVFTLAVGVTHSLLHIEGRYSYSAVPGALLALFWLLGETGMSPARRRMLVTGALVLAVAFIAQTSVWDSSDLVLQRIEASLPSHQ